MSKVAKVKDLLGNFGSTDPFNAKITRDFGEKVLGASDTEHKILIPNLAALSVVQLVQLACEHVSSWQPPVVVDDARKLLKNGNQHGLQNMVGIKHTLAAFTAPVISARKGTPLNVRILLLGDAAVLFFAPEETIQGCSDPHDILVPKKMQIWALAVGRKTEMLATGGGDAVINLWHDCTASDKDAAFRKEEEEVLRGQELENAVSDADYIKAIKLAFELRRPHKLYELFAVICRKRVFKDPIKKALCSLRKEEIRLLFEYVREWNTKPKMCHIAQFVLHHI